MSIRSILAPLTGSTEQQSAVLETAVALAGQHGAWLDAVYVKAEPVQIFRSSPDFTADTVNIAVQYRTIVAEIEAQGRAMRESLAALCRKHGVQPAEGAPPGPAAAWSEVGSDDHRALAHLGRMADLIVLGRPDDEAGRDLLEVALYGAGRPILMVPEWAGEPPGRRVAVAVNDSPEAARALAAALPFLEKAQAVAILTAETPRTEGAVAERARAYLARHGVAAEVRVFPRDEEPPVGKALLGHCRLLDADLLVMGAYSRSRAHERLLGGVTQYMVANLDRPVLMVH